MPSRIASMFLVLLTVGFLVFHTWMKGHKAPPFVQTVDPGLIAEDLVVHNEFLVLMDVGDEQRLSQVLTEFDLALVSPLGEWVHLVKRESEYSQTIIALNSRLGEENQAFVKRLEEHDAIHSAQLNYIQNSEASIGCTDPSIDTGDDARTYPRDPLFKYQWHLSKETGVDLPGAWAITKGSDATVIALVDRNFDFTEDDLNIERCSTRRYFYENILDYFPQKFHYTRTLGDMHGSQVLSVIAPCTDNAVGIAGIDWRAQVFAVDSKDNATFSARMFGILWASGLDICSHSITGCPANSHFQKNQHPANVINTSFGFAGSYLKDPPYGPVLDVISRINRQGRIIIASAGNEGQLADRRLPGAAGGVISVGASNINRRSADFSNVGLTVDVVAPGEDIMSIKNGQPVSLNGTSFSAPIVAGITALMLAANPLLSWKHLEYILKETASPMSCEAYCPSNLTGMNQAACRNYCCRGDMNVCARGIVNAAAAVKMAQAGFPDHALVDVDDYFVALSDDHNYSGRATIKNWGKKAGIMRLRKTDKHLKMAPESIHVPPINEQGVPGTAEVTVFYDAKPTKELVLSLLIEAADIDKPERFHDRIEAIVSIVPDPPHRTRKILREILPKN